MFVFAGLVRGRGHQRRLLRHDARRRARRFVARGQGARGSRGPRDEGVPPDGGLVCAPAARRGRRPRVPVVDGQRLPRERDGRRVPVGSRAQRRG